MIYSVGQQYLQQQANISPPGDEVWGDDWNEALGVGIGIPVSLLVVGAPIVYIQHKISVFFHRPFAFFPSQQKPSPFDIFRKSGIKNIVRTGMKFVWYAQLAYSGGSIAYAGYKNGWTGVKKETEKQFMELTFGNIWMRPIDRYIIQPLNEKGYGN